MATSGHWSAPVASCSFFDGPQPAQRERVERGVAIFERRALDLADPLQHERHRGDLVAALQQRFDDQLKRLGRIELIDEHPPELDVAGRRAGLVPGGQRAGHEVRGDLDFLAHEPLDAADAGRGVFVPPGGEPLERGGKHGFVRRVVDGGRLGPGTGAQVENLLDQLDQVVDAKIVDRVFQRGKQAEVAAEADDVPRVDERAALDAALEQVFDFGKVPGNGFELMGIDRLVARP